MPAGPVGSAVTGGTYTLLLELTEPVAVEVGALGERRLQAGWYAYTGSALGPGGFARVDRHYEVAAGRRDARHWHVDHLLGHPDVAIGGDVRSPALDGECAVAGALSAGPIEGFGASDCACRSHLSTADDAGTLRRAVAAAHRDVDPG